jgi:MFS family permease
VLLLALLVVVESRVAQPIIPLDIISERTTALAILASVAVGVGMFGSSTFLGQYFQVARGATPTEAGLLTLPMIAGNLIGSVVSGMLISRTGKWKRYLLAGAVLLIGGLGLAGTIDHTTELWLTGVYTAILGLGLGLLMQNLVLAVQNTVRATDIGTASASVAFFRSVGGAIGVSVLGAVLANRVQELAVEGFAAAKIPVPAGSAGASMDLKDMPAPVRDIMRAAYGDATAQIFLISAIIGVVALVAVLFIQERPLRRTVDIRPEPAASGSDTVAGTVADTRAAGAAAFSAAPGAGAADLDREFVEVLSTQRADESRFPAAARASAAQPEGGTDRAAAGAGARLRARAKVAGARSEAADVVPVLLQTQQLLAEQQLQLAEALRAVQEQAAEQRLIAAEQARVRKELTALRRQLAKERKLQRAAAAYLATHGRHRTE